MEGPKKRRLDDETVKDPARRAARAQALLLPMDDDAQKKLLFRIVSEIPDAFDVLEEQARLDPVHRKLFIRGLSYDTPKETLVSVFSEYGEVEEVAIITDRTTGRSKGYGFITFRDMDAAYRALDEPTKDIDGRQTICNLAALRDAHTKTPPTGAGSASSGSTPHASTHTHAAMSSHPHAQEDIDLRKLFIRGLSYDTSAERLRALFSEHGEIEDCIIISDKQTGRSKGYGFVTFRTAAAASAALEEPTREIDGRCAHIHYAASRSREQGTAMGGDYGGSMMGGMGMGYPGMGYGMGQGQGGMGYYNQMGGQMPWKLW